MRNFLLILSFLIGASTFAQVNHTDEKGLKQGKWVKTYESGKKRYEGYFKNNVPVGTFIYYFEREGGKMSEIIYRKESGIGYAKAYHSNGVLQAEGIYKNQLRDSTWRYYDKKGILTQSEEYAAGVLDGDQITYYESGKLAEKKTFKNGAQEGVWLRKWEDGKLRTKGIYVDDQLNGECTYFDEEGKLLAKGVYKRDKHGSWYYFEENKVERKEDYRYGELESETIYDTEKEK